MCVGRRTRPAEQARDQLTRLVVAERLDREGGGVRLAASPRTSPLEELRPGRRDEQQRDVAEPLDELVDEVEQAVVGPVQILEDDDDRAALRDRLEEPTPRGCRGCGRRAARAPRARRGRSARPRASAPRLRPPRGGSRRCGACARAQPGSRVSMIAGLALTTSPSAQKRHTVAVRQTPALPPRDGRVAVDDPLTARDEPRLADPGHTHQGHELCAPLAAGPLEERAEDVELVIASHERRRASPAGASTPYRDGRRPPPKPATGSALPLPRTGVGFAIRRSPGASRGYVVWPTRTPLTGAAVCMRAAVFTTSPATIASPRAGLASSVTSASPVLTAMRTWRRRLVRAPGPDRERGAHRALGVVLVRDRRTEYRHHGVADELLDRAAVPLELVRARRVVRGEQPPGRPPDRPLGARREPDEVDEDDRDDLALLTGQPVAVGELARARVAEPRRVGVLVTAARARNHGSSIRCPRTPSAARSRGGGRSPTSAPFDVLWECVADGGVFLGVGFAKTPTGSSTDGPIESFEGGARRCLVAC